LWRLVRVLTAQEIRAELLTGIGNFFCGEIVTGEEFRGYCSLLSFGADDDNFFTNMLFGIFSRPARPATARGRAAWS
jgi:hypothetical protein